MRTRLIMGKHCLQETFKRSPERILKVYTSKKEDPMVKIMEEKGIEVEILPKHKLFSLVQSESHQSFIAKVKELEPIDLKIFLSKQRDQSLIIMCDGISDPQNFGAILRASECFKIDGVVFSKNRGVDITPVVSKVSVGASEIIPIIRISNLADGIKKFQDDGYEIVTAECKPDSVSLYSFTFPEKTVLVIGAEESGIQPLLSKRANFHVEIPMLGEIDSLNVSQATAVFLAAWRHQIHPTFRGSLRHRKRSID